MSLLYNDKALSPNGSKEDKNKNENTTSKYSYDGRGI